MARDDRYMWLMVMFDLPVKTKTERRDATRFRSFLKSDGYDMIQYSIYVRVCRGEAGRRKHEDRVRKNLPPKGSVRCLVITHAQYARMSFLVGQKRSQEQASTEQMLLL